MSSFSSNNTSLNISTEKGSVNTLVNEVYYIFIIPFLCFFGTITNFISVISLIRLGDKNHIYKFMLAGSSTNCLYMFLCGFIFLPNCDRICSIDQNSLIVNIYSLLIIDYFTSSLAILISFIEVAMCLQRYSIITNSKRFKFKKFNLNFPAIVLLSFVVYLPRLFLKEIITSPNGRYASVETALAKTQFGLVLNSLMSIVRGPLFLLVILVINVLTAIECAKLMKKKTKLKKIAKCKGK